MRPPLQLSINRHHWTMSGPSAPVPSAPTTSTMFGNSAPGIPTSQPAPSLPCPPIVILEDNEVNLQDLLSILSNKVIHFTTPANQINIMRDRVLEGALRAFGRRRFDPGSKLDVVFQDSEGSGEGAADEGGPTREFLRLLMREIHSYEIFEGPDWNKILACNCQALYSGKYRLVGSMIAMCIAHGGVEPQFFSQRLYHQVCGLPAPEPQIHEIVDYSFKDKLLKIQSAETEEKAMEAIMEASIELFHGRLQEMIDQFKEGLGCLGLLGLLKRHFAIFNEILMHHPRPLTAKDIAELFKACMSPVGSNRRAAENRAICFWKDWLLEVEELSSYPLTLETLLVFTSGASAIPRLGFPVEPQLEFLHAQVGEPQHIFPEANTCSIVLRLPIHTSYEVWKENMESGILQSPTFGTA
ncbi:hypothetical protein UPYG_G00287790 [Umbra pygmaea]|uniref:HECT-type E3 ubiquitin transferase n=1 Tax=Umbra pygmaea TaxID=75934 RepID=A0ABD0W4B2_UMBPY